MLRWLALVFNRILEHSELFTLPFNGRLECFLPLLERFLSLVQRFNRSSLLLDRVLQSGKRLQYLICVSHRCDVSISYPYFGCTDTKLSCGDWIPAGGGAGVPA